MLLVDAMGNLVVLNSSYLMFGAFFGSLGIIKLARTPPRGWNSYDSFCWTVSEEEFLQNAQLVAQRLKPYGYEVCCVLF